MSALKELQGNTGREHSSTENAYRGIPMFCDPFLHETCFKYVEHESKESPIVVLGSGSGAFDQRLVDHGFTQVTSLDFRPDFFRAEGTTFVERDLNQDFSDLGTYGIIVAIELIEHLENPAHFFRNTHACLKKGGRLVVTTPNIESGPSRVSFLIQRKLSFFTETDMHGSGHISVLPQHIFAFHADNAGFRITTHTYNRKAWEARFSSNMYEILHSLKNGRLERVVAVAFKTLLLAILSPLAGLHRSEGNIHVYVLEKK
jgi:2-polyprenyl-3-methyl-5-hydroxy-6-metoxy-1,4-benzoquinol methylase